MSDPEWDEEAREDSRVKVPRHLRRTIIEFARDHLDYAMAAQTEKQVYAARKAKAAKVARGEDVEATDCGADAGAAPPYYWQRCITADQRAEFDKKSGYSSGEGSASEDSGDQPWDYVLVYKRRGW